MRGETLERLVARLNANAYIPNEQLGDRVMAKPVKLKKGQEFTFASAGGGAAQSKYPWDEWFKGDILLLEQSVGTADEKGTITTVTEKRDFDVAVDSMPAKIKTAARRRYKVVQISRKDADGAKLDSGLIIKARDMTADEKVAEDTLRAEEKAARQEDNAQVAGTVPTAQAS